MDKVKSNEIIYGGGILVSYKYFKLHIFFMYLFLGNLI